MNNIYLFYILNVLFLGLICNPIQNNDEKDNNIEITEQDMDINGHSVSAPLIAGDQNSVQYINDMIIENIKSYIDEESNLYEFRYVVEHNDGRYISIIIETMRYRKPAPYPVSQAHAINIDLKEKTMLYNDNLVSDKKAFCEDIKNGRYALLSEDEIPNNIAYPAGYIENMELEEIEEMFENEQIEIFISNQSLGFIVMLPHAMGSYAVFERTEI